MLRAVHDKVVIQRDPIEETEGGIFLTENVKAKSQRGTVLSVGRQCSFAESGDCVLFSKYGGQDLDVDGKEFHVIPEKRIYAVLI